MEARRGAGSPGTGVTDGMTIRRVLGTEAQSSSGGALQSQVSLNKISTSGKSFGVNLVGLSLLRQMTHVFPSLVQGQLFTSL